MKLTDRRVLFVGGMLLALAACSAPRNETVPETGSGLRFAITEGQADNYLIRGRGISGHLNLRTRPAPRLIVAFPAGNSGAALVFEPVNDEAVWGSVENLRVVGRTDSAGRKVHGLQAEVTLEAKNLSIVEADVGSVRFLRKAVDYSRLPPRPQAKMQIDGNTLRVSRERPDGLSGYLLEVEVLAGEIRTGPRPGFGADADGRLRIRVTATSGDPLETPVSAARLLTDSAGDQQALRQALAFLTYESKMLAGSWRFLTYFGRDTLLSVKLLMPVLTPEAAEIGLGSVLERVNNQGEVAHEEEIGELAVYRNLAESNEATADPVYDYDMVDDNLLLAPVLLSYVESFGARRASRFLSGHTTTAVPLKLRLAANLGLVFEQASAFAAEPVRANLVSIKAGLADGNWRDSEEGLAGGRYPYDVNAVFMPAALHAAAEIVGMGLLDGIDTGLPDREALHRMAGVWEAKAAGLFRVSITAEEARERLATYARDNAYPLIDPPDKDIEFFAVSLDEEFEPIPVMHSDVGADLLFLRRSERHLAELLDSVVRPFPVGLSTPVGILAANPAYAGAREQALVTRNHYHGTVVWSWQQAMIIAGLDAQLRRNDLSPALRNELRTAREDTWRTIEASKTMIATELWSFTLRDGTFTVAPFGQSEDHLTESNAVQLWSTVFLALRPEATAGPR